MHPLLQGIQKRPRMYFGPYPLYASLVVYLAGYETARQDARQASAVPVLSPVLPEGFYEFVCQRLGERSSALGWRGLIAKHTDSDQAAFDLFFELLTAYHQQPTAAA